jgi:hypothetical protein
MKEIRAILNNRQIPYTEFQLLMIEIILQGGLPTTKAKISKSEQADFKLMLKRASKIPTINHASIKIGNKRFSFRNDSQIMGLFEDFLHGIVSKGDIKFRTTNHHILKVKAERLFSILSLSRLSQRKLYPAIYDLIQVGYPNQLDEKYENENSGILKKDIDNRKTSHIRSIMKQNTKGI